MRLVADDVYLLRGFPSDAINVYLVGDVLIDAGTVLAAKRILRQIETREVNAHALTHAHPDHFGSSHRICETREIPLWAPANDAKDVETGDVTPGSKFASLLPSPPAHPVARRLTEGDEVAGFTVLDTPGHSPGHISFWRESDRTLICGDVFWNVANRLTKPADPVTVDPRQNRESMERLRSLSPSLTLFGHGPPRRGGLS
jgi:glyoxylase-like metal-dependent hydrolase (beta-lactamase superfamily II)